MRVFVTQMDIDEGERGMPMGCPLARALRRQSPTGGWCVDGETLDLADEMKTPYQAAAFILAFDTGQAVAPFWLDIPIEHEQQPWMPGRVVEKV